MSNGNKRIVELDFIRGILILLMLIQHFFYFFYRYLYGGIWKRAVLSDSLIRFGYFLNEALYEKPYCNIAMNIGWCIFFVLAGINFNFSKNNKKRALILLIAFSIYYFICFLLQNYTPYPLTLNFGIFLGYAAYILLYEFIKRFPFNIAIISSIVFLILSIFSYIFNFNLEINPLRWFKLSQRINMNYLDQWSIFPSIFFYSEGYILGNTLYKEKKSRLLFFDKKIFSPFLTLGKYSKYIYIGNLIVFPLAFIITTGIINRGL